MTSSARSIAGNTARALHVVRSGRGTDTGVNGTSPSIAATPGALFMALRRGGVIRSRDEGRHWETICPPDHLGASHSHRYAEHGYVWADNTTDRVFYVTFGGLGSTAEKRFGLWRAGSLLSWSDDDGESWTSSIVGKDTWDWPKVLAGPPRPGSDATVNYPNIVYFFGSYPYPLGPMRKVYASRDGGATWSATGMPASDGLEPGYGVVSVDGSIYLDEPYFAASYARLHKSPYPFRLRDQFRLRVLASHDEGNSWEHIVVPDAYAPLAIYGLQRVAVDTAGNLYFVWMDSRDGLPYLTTSTDRGKTWSNRVKLSPPEVRHVHFQVCVTAREPGHIAVSYLGSPQRFGGPTLLYFADGRPYDGWITESFDALDADPVFESGRVNSDRDRIMPRFRLADGAGEGQGITFDPQGVPYATFTKVTRPWALGWGVFMRKPATNLYVGTLEPKTR